MANRNQIPTTGILNLSQHAGKAMKAVDVNSTPIDPNSRFGFYSGKYVMEMPQDAGASATFSPNYAVMVTGVILVAKGTPVAAEMVIVYKTELTGLIKVMYVLDFSGGAREILRSSDYDGSATFTGLNTTQGETITVSSAAGVTDGYQVILEFHNI
jgi:hypothetical protein